MLLKDHEQIISKYKTSKEELLEKVLKEINNLGTTKAGKILKKSKQELNSLRTKKKISYELLLNIAKTLFKE